MATEREKDVEERLRRKVRSELGGIAYKFTSPARRSVPDRLVCLPPTGRHHIATAGGSMIGELGGRVLFVECKAPGEKPTANQEREITRLREMGFRVEVVGTKDAVDALIEELKQQ